MSPAIMKRPAYPSRESLRSRHSADEVSTLDEYAPTTLEVPSGQIEAYLASMRAPDAAAAEAPSTATCGATRSGTPAPSSALSWASWVVTVGIGLGLAFGALLATCMR